MILRNNLGGLGLTINPALRSTFNVAMVRGEGTQTPTIFDPTVSGGFSITQHHFHQIYDEMFPDTRAINALAKTDPAAASALAATRSEVWRAKARALAQGLPVCPSGSVTDGGAMCYHGRGGATFTTSDVRDSWGLIMPGTLVMYGVPFTPADYKDGRITRVLKPDALQRKLLEHAVIRGSLIHLFGKPNRALNPITRMLVGDGHIRDSMRGHLMLAAGGITFVTDDELERVARTASVDQMMEMVPDIKLFLINFERNPIQPDRWRTAPGGWMEWIRNGGYPLSNAVAHAKVPLLGSDSLNPEMCGSILCQCPPSVIKTPEGVEQAAGGQAACVPITLSEAAGISKQGDWRPYVAIYQDVANPLWEVTLVYQDAAWYKKAAEFLAEWMTKLGKLYCGLIAPEAKKQLTQTQADVCTNAQGQTCARGTPGCVCQAATNASMSSAANANLYVQAAMKAQGGMCADWLKEYATPPPMPDPQPLFPPPPPESQGFKLTPMMIALGVAGVGAAVLLTRKR